MTFIGKTPEIVDLLSSRVGIRFIGRTPTGFGTLRRYFADFSNCSKNDLASKACAETAVAERTDKATSADKMVFMGETPHLNTASPGGERLVVCDAANLSTASHYGPYGGEVSDWKCTSRKGDCGAQFREIPLKYLT
jgi:hypothetical protein